MNIEELIPEVYRLYDNYNMDTDKETRQAKANFLYKEIKYYPGDALNKAVDQIISDENIKKFPTVAQIKNYMRLHNSQPIRDLQGCDKCERTGYYTLWQFKQNIGRYYSFAFRCDCALGNSFPSMPLIEPTAIPPRAHNPYPPTDQRHDDYNKRDSK